MSTNVPRFESDDKLLRFAKQFLRDQVERFRKDIGICLTIDRRRRHAYFPALIRCISFADFLGGLHAGNIETHSLSELQGYAIKFMDRAIYDELVLAILYEGFRHKIAHLIDPYPVFDTATKPKKFAAPHRRIAWTVYASKRGAAIKLIRIHPVRAAFPSCPARKIMCPLISKSMGTYGDSYDSFRPRAATAMERG
jgi:hypothetical protein